MEMRKEELSPELLKGIHVSELAGWATDELNRLMHTHKGDQAAIINGFKELLRSTDADWWGALKSSIVDREAALEHWLANPPRVQQDIPAEDVVRRQHTVQTYKLFLQMIDEVD